MKRQQVMWSGAALIAVAATALALGAPASTVVLGLIGARVPGDDDAHDE